MTRVLCLVIVVAACSRGGSKQPALPAGAATLTTYLEGSVLEFVGNFQRFQQTLLILLDPAAAAAAGITFEEDPSPGAPPNSWVYEIPIDADGDGTNDSLAQGTAVFDSPLVLLGPGVSGRFDLTIDLVRNRTVTATLDVAFVGDGVEVSGTWTLEDAPAATTVEVSLDPAAPLVLRPATGAPDRVANACGLNLAGVLDLRVDGPTGLYAAFWHFIANLIRIQVRGVTFTDAQGAQSSLPDTTVDLGSCGGSIDDWVGTWTFDWICEGVETGQSRLVITKTGPDTIHIVDEDLLGSGDTIEYDATADPGNASIVRGTFVDTDGGGTYTEDFVWTRVGARFTQASVYEYSSGPLAGTGGTCLGSATKP